MPDDLDKYLAEQAATDHAELGEYIDKRHAMKRTAPPKNPSRDRSALVAELEIGSDEIAAMDKAFEAKETP